MKLQDFTKTIEKSRLSYEQRQFAGKLMEWVLEDDNRLESLCFYAVLADSFQWSTLPEKEYEV